MFVEHILLGEESVGILAYQQNITWQEGCGNFAGEPESKQYDFRWPQEV